jgi:O-antigen ligase
MLKTLQQGRYELTMLGIALMLLGLFQGRALVSIGMFVLAAMVLITPVALTLVQLRRQWWVWGLLLLFAVPLVSGLWSTDGAEWWARCRVKLPLLLLPLVFVTMIVQRQAYVWLGVLYVALLTIGSQWSMEQYFANKTGTNEAYLRAGVIPTLFDNDHVRFSWAVVIGILLVVKMVWLEKIVHYGWVRWLLNGMALWLIVFLHILSAKTGLLCLYLSAFIIGIFFIIRMRKRWLGIALLLGLAAAPVVAYYTVPTFRNRVHYIRYDFGHYSQGNFKPWFPDGTRVLSLKAGKEIIEKNKWTGVGYGDVWGEMNRWYDKHYPDIKGENRLYPGGQWMMYGAGAGLPAMLVFVVSVLLPLFNKAMRYDASWWALNASACFIFLYEVNLESQFGVFLYAFFILWWPQCRGFETADKAKPRSWFKVSLGGRRR